MLNVVNEICTFEHSHFAGGPATHLRGGCIFHFSFLRC